MFLFTIYKILNRVFLGEKLFTKVSDLQYYDNPDEDPYITLKPQQRAPNADEDDDVDSEIEDVRIRPTDSILIATSVTPESLSQLEVYIYEHQEANLYVHHDILLPAFPLACTRVTYPISSSMVSAENGESRKNHTNFVAVSTMDPEIEIWDLDVLDPVYPALILGEWDKEALSKRSKGKKKRKLPDPHRHVDAVLSLSWNSRHPHLLASGSADTTVKLWDLSSRSCAMSFEHHKDKVQSVLWHPVESTVLATAGYDKTVWVFDTRTKPEDGRRWTLETNADPESIAWCSTSPEQHLLLVACEDGSVHAYDVVQDKRVWVLHAHDGSCSALTVCPHVPGCLVTGGEDGKVKVWDMFSQDTCGPSMVISRDVGSGRVFSLDFCHDEKMVLAVGGASGKVKVWDMEGSRGIRQVFGGRVELVATGEDKGIIEVPHAYGDEDAQDEDSDASEEYSMSDDVDSSGDDV